MNKTFKTASAFRSSLEQRLKNLADSRGTPLYALRLKVTIDRLLARLFARPSPSWLLEGGFAMELRHRPNARTTRDVDLSVPTPNPAATVQSRLDALLDELQATMEIDLGDFFQFRISTPRRELQGAPLGGGRFPVEAILAGKTYAKFHMDIGFGDPIADLPECLTGDNLLSFADIRPAEVLAIPKAQQFAEKVHAYTFPWSGRTDTRVRDLVDLIILIDSGLPAGPKLRRIIDSVFAARNTHTAPETLPSPPETWRSEFELLAKQTQLGACDLGMGFAHVEKFWNEHSAAGSSL